MILSNLVPRGGWTRSREQNQTEIGEVMLLPGCTLTETYRILTDPRRSPTFQRVIAKSTRTFAACATCTHERKQSAYGDPAPLLRKEVSGHLCGHYYHPLNSVLLPKPNSCPNPRSASSQPRVSLRHFASRAGAVRLRR